MIHTAFSCESLLEILTLAAKFPSESCFLQMILEACRIKVSKRESIQDWYFYSFSLDEIGHVSTKPSFLPCIDSLVTRKVLLSVTLLYECHNCHMRESVCTVYTFREKLAATCIKYQPVEFVRKGAYSRHYGYISLLLSFDYWKVQSFIPHQ